MLAYLKYLPEKGFVFQHHQTEVLTRPGKTLIKKTQTGFFIAFYVKMSGLIVEILFVQYKEYFFVFESNDRSGGIRSRIREEDLPAPLRGAPIVLISAALMSIAFMGFSKLSF